MAKCCLAGNYYWKLIILKSLKYFSLLLIFAFGWQNSPAQTTSDIEKSGDVLQMALPVAALASAFIWQNDYGSPAWWQFAKTMGTSFIATHGLKRAIDKERPNGGNHAFPSGHTSAAFTGAAFLERRFGWKAGIPAYLLAGYVGWTRVYTHHHDYWDVLAGAVVGIGSAYLFTTRRRVIVAINKFDDEGMALSIKYRF